MFPLASSLILLWLVGCKTVVEWSLLSTDELCDGQDNDLDGQVDEGLPQHADLDGDGFGDPANVIGCEDGAVVDGSDCDDADAEVNPAADERCDGLDDDCDEAVDEGLSQYADEDGDGFGDPDNVVGCDDSAGAATVGDDCDDGDAEVNPDAEERCDDLDNDCDASVDEGLETLIFYDDADGDGFGDPSTRTEDCEQPPSTTSDDRDCDDSNAKIYPGATERCEDAVVSDCELSIAEARVDCSVGELGLELADGILTGEASPNYAGIAVSSAGDMNGDGVSDVFVGAFENSATYEEAGAAYVVYGPVSGVASLSSADVTLRGEAFEDWLGYAVAGAGDANADGRDDLLVGAPYNDSGGSKAGAAYLLFGPLSGVVKAQDADVVFVGEISADYAGLAVSWAGDTDNDDQDDALIGAPYNDRGGSNAGAAYLFTSLPTGEVSLDEANCIITGALSSDNAGRSVASAGDTDGDGLAEILIGSPYADPTGSESGSVGLFLGPLGGVLSVTDADAKLSGETSGDRAGWDVQSAGDTNADGYDDVLVAALYNDRGGTDAGAAYLLYGPLTSEGLGKADAILIGEATGDALYALAKTPQDLNGDGRPEVVVGAEESDRGGSLAGTIYVFVSPVTGVIDADAADVLLIGEASGDNAGTSIATLADQDGDGLGELLIGAYSNDRGGTNAGAAYLILGGSLWDY
jgi:hypothetical protein